MSPPTCLEWASTSPTCQPLAMSRCPAGSRPTTRRRAAPAATGCRPGAGCSPPRGQGPARLLHRARHGRRGEDRRRRRARARARPRTVVTTSGWTYWATRSATGLREGARDRRSPRARRRPPSSRPDATRPRVRPRPGRVDERAAALRARRREDEGRWRQYRSRVPLGRGLGLPARRHPQALRRSRAEPVGAAGRSPVLRRAWRARGAARAAAAGRRGSRRRAPPTARCSRPPTRSTTRSCRSSRVRSPRWGARAPWVSCAAADRR